MRRYSSINVMTLVKQARGRGAWVVAVDPYRNSTVRQADEHLMVRPGTDSALALAIMHVLIEEGLVDQQYVARATLGYDRLAAHVRGYAPAAVADIVGLPTETIVRFARRYGASPRSFIRIGIGLSRHDNGGMTCRTLACLPALTGAYADPHGGALLSSSQAFDFSMRLLERPDLLRRPAPRVINMIHLGRVLTDQALTPPVRALYVYNSNPAAVCPHQSLVMQGLAREDLFTVVHEQVMTDTARHADLVLPATTTWNTWTSMGPMDTCMSSSRSRSCHPPAKRARTGRCSGPWPAPSGWPRSTTHGPRSSSSGRSWPAVVRPPVTSRGSGCVRRDSCG